MYRKVAAVFTFACLLYSLPVLAGDKAPLVPLPSMPDYTGGEGWGVALGVGIEYEGAYEGSDNYGVELDPNVTNQYRFGNQMIYQEGVEFAYRNLIEDQWLITAGAYYEDGLAPDDSDDDFLEGIEERDAVFSVFFETKHAFDPMWKNWIAARYLTGPSDFGWWAEITAGHRFSDSADGSGTEAWFYYSYGDADFFNRGFGVTAEDAANSGLTETDLSGGSRSLGFFVTDRRQLTDSIQLISKLGTEFYSSEIRKSPIAQDDYKLELGTVLVWHF
ncbi:MAG: MipA/OmpV family protein [Pseudomonadota bacterium]